MRVGDRAANGEIIVAGVAEADSVTDLVGDRRLAIAAIIEIVIVRLVVVHVNVAIDLVILAAILGDERRGLRRAAVSRIHENDIGALAVDLLEAGGNEIVPQLDRRAGPIPLRGVERREIGHEPAEVGLMRIVVLTARRALKERVSDLLSAVEIPLAASASEVRDCLVKVQNCLAVGRSAGCVRGDVLDVVRLYARAADAARCGRVQ